MNKLTYQNHLGPYHCVTDTFRSLRLRANSMSDNTDLPEGRANMIDRYTQILLTVIAVNLTLIVGWGAVKVLVPEVAASRDLVQHVYVTNDPLNVNIKEVDGWSIFGGKIPVKLD